MLASALQSAGQSHVFELTCRQKSHELKLRMSADQATPEHLSRKKETYERNVPPQRHSCSCQSALAIPFASISLLTSDLGMTVDLCQSLETHYSSLEPAMPPLKPCLNFMYQSHKLLLQLFKQTSFASVPVQFDTN